MSAHYLVESFSNPIANSKILDVRQPTNGQSIVNGCFVIRVPDNISVQNPTSLNDLLTKKYQGVLAFYAGFPNVVYDDLLDATGLDLTPPTTGGVFGERGVIAINPSATLQTNAIPLVGPPVAQCVPTWEANLLSSTDPKVGRFTRTYLEVVPTTINFLCQVSTNGGTNFSTATDGSVLNIPLAQQGNSLVFKLTNLSTTRIYVSSWAVVY